MVNYVVFACFKKYFNFKLTLNVTPLAIYVWVCLFVLLHFNKTKNNTQQTPLLQGELCCTRGQTAKGEDGQGVGCYGKHCNCCIGPSPFVGRKCPSHRQLTSSKMSSCALENRVVRRPVHILLPGAPGTPWAESSTEKDKDSGI